MPQLGLQHTSSGLHVALPHLAGALESGLGGASGTRVPSDAFGGASREAVFVHAAASTTAQERARSRRDGIACGAEGDRTPDLIHAMDALSQLSYGPENVEIARTTAESLPYFV